MAWVRDSKGKLLRYDDEANAKLMVDKFGATPVSDEEAAAEKEKAAQKAEAGSHPFQSAAEGAFTGAVNAFTAIPRAVSAVGGVADRALGTGMVGGMDLSDPLAGMTGENALAGIKSIVSDPTSQQTQQQNDAGTQQYMQGVQQRAEANPLSHGAGSFGGSLVGMGPGVAAGRAIGDKALAAGASKGVAAFAEGAAFGVPQGIADASEEAQHQHSALTGSQALAYGGLGGLLAGGFTFFGKKAEGLWAARQAAEDAGGSALEAIPDLEVHGGKTTPVNPHAESDLMHLKRGEPEMIPDLEVPARKPAAMFPGVEPAPAVPELEMPVGRGASAPEQAHLDLEMSSASEHEPAMFQRNTRYSPGQRDLDIGAAGETDLPLGGVKGSEVHPEELRAALNGEALNSKYRADKVKKLIQPIPEGATPEWVMNMSEEERIALADYTGSLKYTSSGKPIPPSDTTWKALADAVAEREGFVAEPAPLGHPGEDITPTAHTTAAEHAAPYNPASGFGTPPAEASLGPSGAPAPAYNPGAGAALPGEMPSLEGAAPGAFGAEAKPSWEPTYGGGSDAAIGESQVGAGAKFHHADNKAPLPPDVTQGKGGWDTFKNHLVRWSGRRIAGGIVGGAIGGGMFGPLGYQAGGVGGELAMAAYEKMPALAAKAAKVSQAAIDGALYVGHKTPRGTAALLGVDTADYFLGKQKTPERAYQARTKELQALQSNPTLISDKVGEAFGHLANTERGAIAAVTESAQRGIDYLLQHAPTSLPDPTSLTPLASRPTPNRTDISEFSRLYNAVMYPTTVLADIKHGLVTKDQIDAIKYVHPQWYQENIVNPVLAKMRERDVEMEPFDPAQRRTIDTLLGIQTGVDEAKFADHYAPLFQKAVAAQTMPSQQSDQSSGRKLGKRSVISSSYLSQTSKMLGVDSK